MTTAATSDHRVAATWPQADHPGAIPSVSIFAHSLGSVLILDLLTHGGRTVGGVRYPKLPFDVDCFFAAGSPAAWFLLARAASRSAEEPSARVSASPPRDHRVVATSPPRGRRVAFK